MMMLFHLALSLELIALVLGVGLYVWSHQCQGCGTGFAKLIGMLVAIIAILGIFCTSYSGYKAWQEEMYFKNMMHMQNMQPSADANMSAPAAPAKSNSKRH